jgi:hypothetical protein
VDDARLAINLDRDFLHVRLVECLANVSLDVRPAMTSSAGARRHRQRYQPSIHPHNAPISIGKQAGPIVWKANAGPR